MFDPDIKKYEWLNHDNDKCNSDEFFKQISYFVDL